MVMVLRGFGRGGASGTGGLGGAGGAVTAGRGGAAGAPCIEAGGDCKSQCDAAEARWPLPRAHWCTEDGRGRARKNYLA
jgi:hypothetical protein